MIPTERIYIGGLDPSRLTVRDVSSRLRSIAGVDIVSVDDSAGNRSFFFVEAKRSGKLEEGDNLSALHLVGKLYHNVKWKGCKLSVEGAKPHFLQRLASERQERTQRGQSNNPKKGEPEAQIERCPTKLPRHLRIRQRFGEEAYCVDRKPCLTDDWANFSSAMNRMRNRREKYHKRLVEENRRKHFGPKEARMKPFLNRAVHLVFNERTSAHTPTKPLSEEITHLDSQFSTPLHSESGLHSTETRSFEQDGITHHDSSSEGYESSGSKEQTDTKIKSRTCSWFDDDGDAAAKDVHVSAVSESVLQDTFEAGDRNDKTGIYSYVWSSDDEESSTDEKEDEGTQKMSPAYSSADDFASGINMSETDETGLKKEASDEASLDMEPKTDLAADVKSNLDVLSQLFPDMANVTPTIVPHGQVDDGKSRSVQHEATVQPGWEIPVSDRSQSLASKLGVMQRYDPTKESAKKYVVSQASTGGESSCGILPDELTEGESEEAGTVPKDSFPENGSVTMDQDALQHVGEQVYNIYEQNKLEHIFRQSGEAEAEAPVGDQLASHFQTKEQSTLHHEDESSRHGGTFAFSFDLKNDSAIRTEKEAPARDEEPSDSGGISFSLNLNSNGTENGEPASDPDENTTGIERIDHHRPRIPKDDVQTVGVRRHWGVLPKKVLKKYESDFYDMNEGTRILEDLDCLRNDNVLRTQWLEERHMLTQDWKRKRKYAQSNIRKTKTKFRSRR